MSVRQATLSGSLTRRSLKTHGGPLVNGVQPLTLVAQYLGFTSATSGAANTPGAYTQVAASTPAQAGLLFVTNNVGNFGADNGCMLDIAVGAAGSESIIVPNLATGASNVFSKGFALPIPVRIPASSRIAYRVRAGIASRSVSPTMALYRLPQQHLLPTSVDVIGSSAATSHSTALSGASGTYTQITASTSQAYQALVIIPAASTNVGINATFSLTLAIGPAGAEVDIGSFEGNQQSNASTGPIDGMGLSPGIIAAPIPIGSRLSIKHNIAANPQYIEVCLVGVPL